ncbi:MAG: GldM family protein [Bacteroidales bacterium]|nr:GldM family protein [Bacteroidales bacterium]
MKRLSLIALMLFVSCISLNAQTTSTPKAVVAATTPQILYRGADNPISIAVNEISDEYIIAEVSNGSAKIKKVGKGSYIVNIEDKITLVNVVIDSVDTKGVEYQLNRTIKIPNDVITIGVYSQLGKEKVFLNQTTFKVKDIVYPNAKVVKSDGGLIDKKDLLKNPYINLEVEDFDFPVEYNINYFYMTFNTSKNTEAPLISKSNKFTPEMIEKIKTLKKGDKIYIEAIKATGDDSKEVKVANPQMIFTIK